MSNPSNSSEQKALNPQPGRPDIPGYGIPTNIEGTLPWSHVEERMAKARNYWVGTVGADARPHAVPVWGVWVEGTLCFGSGPDTRWSRNLAANPKVAVHLESGDDVVILEGVVEQITDSNHPLVKQVDDASKAKYQMGSGSPFWVLRPQVAFAWSQFPTNATRWRFAAVE
jgi:hypothetical protein